MKRLSPFSGMQVSLFDLTFSSDETASAVKQRISDLFDRGAVAGLTVGESGTFPGEAFVTLGTAYDPNGERIRVPVIQDGLKSQGLALNADVATYTVVARYVQGNDGQSGLDVDGNSQFRHLTDDFSIVVLKGGVDSLGDDDVRLSGVETTIVGGTLIIDSNIRDIFNATFNNGFDFTVSNLVVPGTMIVGGTATFQSAVIFEARVDALSDIHCDGDFIADTASKGVIVTSPDGTKTGRMGIDNDGFLAVEPLNYTL